MVAEEELVYAIDLVPDLRVGSIVSRVRRRGWSEFDGENHVSIREVQAGMLFECRRSEGSHGVSRH